jgi:tRNA nucleotidyltransferase (CCA-adding enzyme)
VVNEAQLRDGIWKSPWSDLRQPVEDAAAATGATVYVVGGVPRDVLLGRDPADFDLTVVGEAEAFARTLANRLGTEVEVNRRFGTAELNFDDGRRVDIASARCETYEVPGALPVVTQCGVQQDLARRDFTVNTLALGLAGEVESGLLGAVGAREDLEGRVVRVLHDGSFVDDPTRILRAVRLELSAGFEMEEQTLNLARQALDEGHLAGVSGQRIWREWKMLLACGDPVDALRRLDALGFLAALAPGLRWSEGMEEMFREASRLAVELASDQSSEALQEIRTALILLALSADDESIAGTLAARLVLPRKMNRQLEAWPTTSQAVALLARPEERPSEIHRVLGSLGLAELACLAALSGESGAHWVGRELSSFRALELRITAEDLLASGASEGPALGRALQRTLAARLDGDIEAGEELDYASGVLTQLDP